MHCKKCSFIKYRLYFSTISFLALALSYWFWFCWSSLGPKILALALHTTYFPCCSTVRPQQLHDSHLSSKRPPSKDRQLALYQSLFLCNPIPSAGDWCFPIYIDGLSKQLNCTCGKPLWQPLWILDCASSYKTNYLCPWL